MIKGGYNYANMNVVNFNIITENTKLRSVDTNKWGNHKKHRRDKREKLNLKDTFRSVMGGCLVSCQK